MVMTIVNPSKIPTAESSEVMSASGGGASPATSTCSSVGRWKAPPVCVDASLKEAAMSTHVLSKLTFPPDFLPIAVTTTPVDTSNVKEVTTSDHRPHHQHHAVPVSSSSSTCTRDSDTGVFSDVEIKHDATTAASIKTPESTASLTPSRLLRSASDRMNSIVSLRKTSRQGRLTQRWVTDPDTANVIRLTTGCVPILQDGKILFVSASRKAEWIIPKGGWEKDETMEESAVRECFEEAGVLGVLGPKLNEIQYETRKAKKRRLEQEQQQQRKKQATEEALQDKKVPATEQESSERHESSNGSNTSAATSISSSTSAAATSLSSSTSAAAPLRVLSEETMSRIRKQLDAPKATEASGETSSVASTTTYSQVRMTLFPLYVTHVADAWPESGRFRKAVDIDEAIEMLESRPELKAALVQVKEKGLHLPASQSAQRPTLL